MKKAKKNTFIGIAFLTSVLLIMISAPLFSQNQLQPVTIDSISSDSTILTWLKNLNEEGVTVIGDSVIMNAETMQLLTDSQYRQIIYPQTYTWDKVVNFIKTQELRKAFWYLMNLYLVNDKYKEIAVKSFLVYDRIFKLDKILVNTFYTYILTDPEIGTIVMGHSKITSPHIMEKKLNAVKEILFYLDKYKPKDRKEDQN